MVQRRMRRLLFAIVVVVLLVTGASSAGGAAPPVPKPTIVWRPIPFPALRKQQTSAYSLRHYGRAGWRLEEPHVIVEHYTANDSFSATWNTFASDAPDPELHKLPGTCAHFVVDTDGTIYQLVPLGHSLPPHGRAELDGDRDRARRHERRRHPRQPEAAAELARADCVADEPVPDLARRRDRPRREPDLALPPRAGTPPGAARRTATGPGPTWTATGRSSRSWRRRTTSRSASGATGSRRPVKGARRRARPAGGGPRRTGGCRRPSSPPACGRAAPDPPACRGTAVP